MTIRFQEGLYSVVVVVYMILDPYDLLFVQPLKVPTASVKTELNLRRNYTLLLLL